MTPISPSSQLVSQSNQINLSSTSPVLNFIDSLPFPHQQESDIIEDSDQFTTPPQASKYFTSSRQEIVNLRKSVEEKIHFSQEQEETSDEEESESESHIQSSSQLKQSPQSKPQKSTSVGIDSFRKFQYSNCN